FSSRRRHTRSKRDWSSDVCSSDLKNKACRFTLRENSSLNELLFIFPSSISFCSFSFCSFHNADSSIPLLMYQVTKAIINKWIKIILEPSKPNGAKSTAKKKVNIGPIDQAS